MIIDINNTYNKYGIVYTDPPWQHHKGGYRSHRPIQGVELDYSTMTLEEIKTFFSKFLCRNTEYYHNVFMWTIDAYLHKAEQMMSELGYTLHARMIWDKENGIAPAFTVRFSHEYLLWFYMPGRMLKPVKETRGKYRTVFREPSRWHSRKPEIVYEMLEDMFPNTSKIELFARRQRNGWDCFGNEL